MKKIEKVKKLLKQKDDYPYEYMNSFKRFNEEKLPARKYFYTSIKDGRTGNNGKISEGHIILRLFGVWKKLR